MNKLVIKPLEISASKIEYEIYNYDEMSKIRTNLARKAIELEENFIRESLIKIGWTPPKEEETKNENNE